MTRNLAMDLGALQDSRQLRLPWHDSDAGSRNHMERVGITLEEFVAAEGAKNLIQRVGDPREVAYAILFLASDEASFVTGAHLMVDGVTRHNNVSESEPRAVASVALVRDSFREPRSLRSRLRIRCVNAGFTFLPY